MTADELRKRLEECGVNVVKAPAPAANYVPYVRTGNQLFISGQVSIPPGGEMLKGRLGAGVSIEDGAKAARVCGENLLLQLLAYLDESGASVSRCVKLGGFVNSTPEFGDHPKVINGCSDLMVDVLGDAGRHARFALGVANLPFGLTTEIDAIFEIH